MATTTSNVVFDDLFKINSIDKDGKKFDRVSRLFAHSSNYDMELTLDYNTELYPLKTDESFSLVLASSLVRGVEGGAVNGTEADDEKDTHIWRPDGKGRRGLEEDYEYVMYGRVYKFDGGAAEVVTAYLSFGGLLMTLTGSYRHMTGIVLGDPVYLLMRR
ncbi:RPB8 [Sanghuangporus weigelae]